MNPSFLAPSVGNSAPEVGATFSILSSSNVFLTQSSLGLQSISMSTLGQSVFLPPSYSVVPGQTKFSIKNNGTYPFGVRDSLGNLITSIVGSGSAIFSLDNSSNWLFTGNNLEPGLVTIDNTFSATFTTTILFPFVALDTNTSIHFSTLASGFAAFVVDNAGKVVSTPVTVSALASDSPRTIFRISSTQALLFFFGNSSLQSAVVLTLSGTSPSLSLSIGTAATITSPIGGGWAGEDFVSAPKFAQLSTTLYVFSYINGTNTAVQAVSVTGSTVTIGTAANIITTNSVNASTTTYALTATTALVLYKTGAAAPFANNAVVISVAGTTCTVNTPAVLTGCAGSLGAAPPSVLVSATKCVVSDDNNTANSTVAIAVTITGTAVAAGTALNFTSATGGILNTYVVSSATRYNPHLWALSVGSTNTLGVWFLDVNGVSSALVLSETAGTIVAGTILYRSISSGNGTAINDFGQIFPQGSVEFLALKQEGPTSAGTIWRFRVVGNKISGTNITAGSSAYTDSISPGASVAANGIGLVRLSSSDYLIVTGTNGSVDSIPVIRNNGDAINYRGSIKVPSLFGGQLAQAGTFTNRMVVLGQTQFVGTTVAAGTFQLRLLNVEIAQ